jgi:AraC family L-rhamnose operon transcriptional activator RhaR
MTDSIDRVPLRRAFLDGPPYIKVMHGMLNNKSMTAHRHDFLEIVLVLGGSGVHMENGLPRPVKAGDLLIITGDMTHGYENTRDLEIGNIAFCRQVLKPYLPWLMPLPGYTKLFSEVSEASHIGAVHRLQLYARHLAKLAELVRSLEEECSGKAPGYETAVTGLFLQLVTLLCRVCVTPGEPTLSDPMQRIASVLDFMNEHYMDSEEEAITLESLARHAHMSANNLIRVFKQTMDMPPIEYLIRLRVRKACEMLADPERQIKGIAFAVGFNDSNYFTRQFRRIMGIPPSEFRHRPGA